MKKLIKISEGERRELEFFFPCYILIISGQATLRIDVFISFSNFKNSNLSLCVLVVSEEAVVSEIKASVTNLFWFF
jgi:hypothetical protein